MSWIEILMIVVGVSLDIFATMECQGSLVRKVNKKHLSIICILFTACQLCALFLGYFISSRYCKGNPAGHEMILGQIIAVIIFLGLGVRFIIKAVRNEAIDEHLITEFHIGKFVKIAFLSCITTSLSGLAFGFFSLNLIVLLVLMVFCTIFFIVTGKYTGYHYGFEQKRIAYIIGAVLFVIAGADVIFRYILKIV